MQPQLLTYQQKLDLEKTQKGLAVVDNINLYLNELFDIAFPSKKDTKSEEEVEKFANNVLKNNPNNWGKWVYLPWLNLCQHIPPKRELRQLRTSRNRNLITENEQQMLYNTTILIAGMSVGSNVVEALISQGIGTKFVLADMDIIEPTNLNRIRAPLHHIGLHKVEAISRKIWEIDPYIEIIACNNGISEEIINDIVANHKIDIIVDEMDSPAMKVLLREIAQKEKLPVVMAADDGDDALVDIERYDLNHELPIFNNQIPLDVIDRIKGGNIPRKELGMMIGKYFVGPEHIPLRMFESLVEIGKTLPSWPQLGGAAALSGISLAYVIKKIILGQPVKDGRILISLDEKLLSQQYNDEQQVKAL